MKSLKISKECTAKCGNVKKFEAYREGFARIDAAIAAGFPIEAIAIEETIITDRISSHLGHHNSLPKGNYPSFGELIKKLGKLPLSADDSTTRDLVSELDQWRIKRNTAIHAIVKSKPGMSPTDTETFLQNALEAARQGKSLARKVCSWHRKEKKRT